MTRRSVVNDVQRKSLRDHARKNPNMGQSSLRQWFVKKHGIEVSQSFVSVSLSDKFQFLDSNIDATQLNTETKSRLGFPQLEKALYHLIITSSDPKAAASAPEIRREGRRLWAKISPEKKMPVFSNGWVHAFRRRHGLKRRNIIELSPMVPKAENLIDVDAIIKRYDPADVFTCAETLLYYTHTPDKIVDELSKNKLMVHLCCNSDGTIKAPPWYIGHSQNNKCFDGKDTSALPYMYISHDDSCMTASIFHEWLLAFDQHAVLGDRKVLLILDDFSAHRSAVKSLQDSKLILNTDVCFLPLGTTSKTQAFNKGIFRIYKAHYRSRWLDFIWQESQLNRPFFDTLDILKVIDWCNYAWKEIPSGLIQTCWNKTDDSLSSAEPVIDPGLCEKLNFSISVLSGKGVFGSPIGSIDDFLLPKQESVLEIPDGDTSRLLPARLHSLSADDQELRTIVLGQLPESKSLKTAPSIHPPLLRGLLSPRSPFQNSPLELPPLQNPPLKQSPLEQPQLKQISLQHPPLQHPPLRHPSLQHPPLQHPPLRKPLLETSSDQQPQFQRPELKSPLQHSIQLPHMHTMHPAPHHISSYHQLHPANPLQRQELHSVQPKVLVPGVHLNAFPVQQDCDSDDNTPDPLFLQRGKALVQIDGVISYMEQEGNATPDLLELLKSYRSSVIEQQAKDIRALSMGNLSVLESPRYTTRQTATPKSSIGDY